MMGNKALGLKICSDMIGVHTGYHVIGFCELDSHVHMT